MIAVEPSSALARLLPGNPGPPTPELAAGKDVVDGTMNVATVNGTATEAGTARTGGVVIEDTGVGT